MNKKGKVNVWIILGIIAVIVIAGYFVLKDKLGLPGSEDKSGGGMIEAHFTDAQGNEVPILTAQEFEAKYGFLPQSFLKSLNYVNIDPAGTNGFAYGVANVYFTLKTDVTGSATKVRTWIKSATQSAGTVLFPTSFGALPSAKVIQDPAGIATCGANAKCYQWTSTSMAIAGWATSGGQIIDFGATVGGESEFPPASGTWTALSDTAKLFRIVFYTDPTGTYVVTFNPVTT